MYTYMYFSIAEHKEAYEDLPKLPPGSGTGEEKEKEKYIPYITLYCQIF